MTAVNTYLVIAFDLDEPADECHFMHKYIDLKTFIELKSPETKEVFLEEKKYCINYKRTAVIPFMATKVNWIIVIDVKRISA